LTFVFQFRNETITSTQLLECPFEKNLADILFQTSSNPLEQLRNTSLNLPTLKLNNQNLALEFMVRFQVLINSLLFYARRIDVIK